MNTDYSYCSGVTCSIRKSCKRYLPDPPDTRLQWVWPATIRKQTNASTMSQQPLIQIKNKYGLFRSKEV